MKTLKTILVAVALVAAIPFNSTSQPLDLPDLTLENIFGGKWAAEPDTGKMAGMIINHINQKRENLGISKGRERVLFDMEMRRELAI